MARSVPSATVSSRTIVNDGLVMDGRAVDGISAGFGGLAPALANFGTATAKTGGNRVTAICTAGTPTTGATITVLHSRGAAPRAVAVAQVSGPNTPEFRVLPASISTTQFVITCAVAPVAGTYVLDCVIVD